MPQQPYLTPQQIEQINAARRLLNDMIPDIDAAEKCGVDCTKRRQERDRIASSLEQIVLHFSGRRR